MGTKIGGISGYFVLLYLFACIFLIFYLFWFYLFSKFIPIWYKYLKSKTRRKLLFWREIFVFKQSQANKWKFPMLTAFIKNQSWCSQEGSGSAVGQKRTCIHFCRHPCGMWVWITTREYINPRIKYWTRMRALESRVI